MRKTLKFVRVSALVIAVVAMALLPWTSVLRNYSPEESAGDVAMEESVEDILRAPQDYDGMAVRVRGTLRAVSDDSQMYLQDGSRSLPLRFIGSEAVRTDVNADVVAEGVVRTVADSPRIDVTEIARVGGRGVGTRSLDISGPQTLLIVLVKFADHLTTRWTSSQINSLIFENFTPFWNEVSYGDVPSFSGDTTPWYDLSGNEVDYYVPATDTDPAHCCEFHMVTQEAVDIADGNGYDLRTYGRLVVLFNIGFRGLGTSGWTYSTSHGDVSLSAALVGENPTEPPVTVWGRIAHEMGHEFGLPHVTRDYNNPYALMAKLYPGHAMSWTKILAGWMPASNVAVVERDSSADLVVRPLELSLPGDTQVIKVVVSETFYYLVEVRRFIGYDDVAGSSLPMPDEGVLIYEVDERRTAVIDGELHEIEPIVVVDAKYGTDTLDDAPFDAQEACGAPEWPGCTPYNIQIRVITQVGNGFQIRVLNDLMTNVPDVTIKNWGSPPGSPPPFETDAVWIDSYANGFNYYRYNDGNPRNPTGNGDDPWLGHMNRVYATVENKGGSTAFGTRINFYENTPIGIGDRGDWNLIDFSELDLYAGDSQDVHVEWTPRIDPMPTDVGILTVHSCIKVEIEPVPGEVDTANQHAQENIAHFESVPGSDFTPANTTFVLSNPLPHQAEILLMVSQVPSGWTVVLNRTHLILGSHKTAEIAISVKPPLTTLFGQYGQVEVKAIAVSPSPHDDFHTVELGGITFSVHPVEKLNVVANLDRPTIRPGETALVTGTTTPALAGLPMIAEVTAPNGTTTLIPFTTATGGSFSAPFVPHSDGDWILRVFFAGNATISSGASAKLVLHVVTPPPEGPTTIAISVLVFAGIVVGSLIVGSALGYALKGRRVKKSLPPPPPP